MNAKINTGGPMNEVRRFTRTREEIDTHGHPYEVEELCVSASDYDALAARVQELERERDELKKKAYRYAHWTPEHTIEEWLADRQRIVEAKQVEADAALRQQLAEAQGRVTEVGELNVKLRDAEQQVARLREAALWAMKKVKRLSPRAVDYKRADDFIQHEEALKGA